MLCSLLPQWDIKDFHHRCFRYFPTSLKYKTSSFGHRHSNSNICVQHHGSVVGIYLYYDGSIEYFGKKHLPYAILAVFVALTFILFPLLVYCCICFQRCLGCCGVRMACSSHFHGCFSGLLQRGLETANTLQLCTSF